MNRDEKYIDQGLDPDADYVAKCSVCDEFHEWWLDDGMGGAFGQGWVSCDEYGGAVPTGKESAVTSENNSAADDLDDGGDR